MTFLWAFIALVVGWFAASFIAQLTGYNVAAYFVKGYDEGVAAVGKAEAAVKADIANFKSKGKKS